MDLAASPLTLYQNGGSVVLAARAANAATCTFSSHQPLPGLPATVPCSNGMAIAHVTIPENLKPRPQHYGLRVSVRGPSSSATLKIIVSRSPAPGSGIATLSYSGVLSGRLANTVSNCQPRPNLESEITVNGTLNGTPWVLIVQSYDAQSGVWQVLTGQAGGGTGMIGQGYAVTATYPATVSGFTQIDWAHGTTLDVQMSSGSGQSPTGKVEVQGTVTCG